MMAGQGALIQRLPEAGFPVTPAGGVYCTENFAAALLLEGSDCAFALVGRKPLAKGFGEVVLYRLGAADPAH